VIYKVGDTFLTRYYITTYSIESIHFQDVLLREQEDKQNRASLPSTTAIYFDGSLGYKSRFGNHNLNLTLRSTYFELGGF
jgi:hypothetical protein